MATIVTKGNNHSVVFWHRNETGERVQRWLPAPNMEKAIELKNQIEFAAQDPAFLRNFIEAKFPHKKTVVCGSGKKNPSVEYVGMEWIEFMENEKDTPLSPNTLDAYRRVTTKNIIPFFDKMKIADITGIDIANFRNYLYKYGLEKKTVDKYVVVLNRLLDYACAANYIKGVPKSYKPGNRKSRSKNITNPDYTEDYKGWDYETTMQFISAAKDDFSPECIAAETALCNSLRNGETMGILMANINEKDNSIRIDRELQRIPDRNIEVLSKEMIFCTFPKIRDSSSSTLVLMPPKNEISIRPVYPPAGLWRKILRLMEHNETCKELLGDDYHDYGLLFCFEDGRPMENDYIVKAFRKLQTKYGIPKDKQIDFQGLRRTGQKLKMDLSGHNAKLVAEMAGHSDVVLQSNYNYATAEDKRQLMDRFNQCFYGGADTKSDKR